MSISLLLRRLTLSHLSHLNAPPPATFSSVYRLLSSTAPQAPSPPRFAASEYLTRSCGLPSDEAIQVSKRIQHLKSPDKPDALLRFLRQTGLSDSHIRAAVSREPRILCSHVENNLRPNVAKLQEVGLSTEDISGIISRNPGAFLFNFVPKIDFWMRALGSAKDLSVVLKKSATLLTSNLEKVAVPNLSFLQECGLSVRQIAQLIKSASRVISSKPYSLKIKAERAKALGVRCPSTMFVYALITVCKVNQRTIDARLNYLKNLGFSQEEVTTLFSKHPLVLRFSEEVIGRKIEFLTKEVGLDKLFLVQNPVFLSLSLEKRLIPRYLVRKILWLKGFTIANLTFTSFVIPPEKRFVEKFVLPYEPSIPGLHQAYADACAGNITGIKWFKSILS